LGGSRHPLSDEKTSTIDGRLVGRWRAADDSYSGTFVVSRLGASRLEAASLEKSPGGEQEKYSLFTTSIGSHSYMSVGSVAEKGRAAVEAGYRIVEYSLPDKDTLVIRDMDEEKVTAAIKAKELRGKAESHNEYAWLFGWIPVPYTTTSVMIDDSPKALVRYVQKHADDCFEKTAMLTLKREK
jgi:hypothetical protein